MKKGHQFGEANLRITSMFMPVFKVILEAKIPYN